MFSDSEAEDKIRCKSLTSYDVVVLFDIFDFNEMLTLSTLDLEFAIQSLVMSTSKIFNIGADLNEEEIFDLVHESFNEGIRLNLAMVLRWCSCNSVVFQFFEVFRMIGAQHVRIRSLTHNQTQTYQDFLNKQTQIQEEN